MAASIRHVKQFKKLLRNSFSVHKASCEKVKLHQFETNIRFHHVLSTNGYTRLPGLWKTKNPQICAVFIQRFNSTDNAASIPPTDYIPEPPLPPPESLTLSDTLNAIGEPTFASLGLNHYTPSGFVQMALEALHVDIGVPWWGAIMIATVCVRLLIFPLVITSRKHMIKMTNHMPYIQKMQEQMNAARRRGDQVTTARLAVEIQDYVKKNDIKFFRNMFLPLAQLPIFLSWFIGLRHMVNLPVESLQTGGILWFTDLCIPDSTFLLPLITMSTLAITVEIGAEGVAASQQTHVMKWVMRAFPVLGMLFVCNFPSAMCVYWLTSNTFSLIQVLFLKIPPVKKFFGIPDAMPASAANAKKKGFVEGFRESYANAKVTNEVQNRMRADAMKFRKAGQGPIPKTFPINDPAQVQRIAKGIKVKSK